MIYSSYPRGSLKRDLYLLWHDYSDISRIITFISRTINSILGQVAYFLKYTLVDALGGHQVELFSTPPALVDQASELARRIRLAHAAQGQFFHKALMLPKKDEKYFKGRGILQLLRRLLRPFPKRPAERKSAL